MTAHQTQPAPSPAAAQALDMALSLEIAAVPQEVVAFAKLLALDLIGVAAAAGRLTAARIARDHAAKHWTAGPDAPAAPIPFDGRAASLPGAAYAMATQIDNLDAHDGWQPSKGHAGAALLPALVASAAARPDLSGAEALAMLVSGYEISYRAAAALHATVDDYHTSGAWNAIGAALIAGRALGLDAERLRHAAGIAEYHGPRSQMMREIRNPTMLHDGSGMGAPIGIMAALLAQDGFTGAPAAVLEFDDVAAHWTDLGQRWLTNEQYIKPYPICRWSHAPIDAAFGLRKAHGFHSAEIERIEIFSFAYLGDMSMTVPETSPKAQYSLAWPVACAFARGRVGVDEVLEESFSDPELRRLTAATRFEVAADLEARYPADRIARLRVTLQDGRVFESGDVTASGGPDPSPSAAEVASKFRAFAEPALGPARAARILEAVDGLDAPGARWRDVGALIAAAP